MDPRKDLKDLIRDGVRMTIRQTLGSVIQEVTEEELRGALRDPSFKEPLSKIINIELQRALEDLHRNGKKKRVSVAPKVKEG